MKTFTLTKLFTVYNLDNYQHEKMTTDTKIDKNVCVCARNHEKKYKIIREQSIFYLLHRKGIMFIIFERISIL